MCRRVSPLAAESATEELSDVVRRCRRVAVIGAVVWAGLLLAVFGIAPKAWRDTYVYLETGERYAATASAIVKLCALLMQYVSRTVVAAVDTASHSRRYGKEGERFGLRVLSDAVAWIATLNEVAMAALKVPVVIDRVTKTRTHLVRWIEWSVTAYLMTYMIEATDVAKNQRANEMAWTQAVSTACAFFFPFAPNTTSWCALMAASLALYARLFPRLAQKTRRARRAREILTQLHVSAETSVIGALTAVQEHDTARRIVLASALMWACVGTWSCFVVVYFIEWGLGGGDAWWPFAVDSALSTVVKLYFSNLIASCDESLFSGDDRMARENQALRTFIGAGWLTAADGTAVAVEDEKAGTVMCVFSPSFLRMIRSSPNAVRDDTADDDSITWSASEDLGIDELRCDIMRMMSEVNVAWDGIDSSTTMRRVAEAMFEDEGESPLEQLRVVYSRHDMRLLNVRPRGLTSLVQSVGTCEIVEQAWSEARYTIVPGVPAVVPWHFVDRYALVTSTLMEPRRVLLVFSDVTSRVDKNRVQSRADMNQAGFDMCRHDVKNALLDVIEQSNALVAGIRSRDAPIEEEAKGLAENLKDCLRILVDDHVSRTLAAGAYAPNDEPVRLREALQFRKRSALQSRFLLHVDANVPDLVLLDATLLRLVHSNACGNAIKYGDKSGPITTRVACDAAMSALIVTVTNLPGPNHRQLCDKQQSDAVFKRGVRLEDPHDTQSWGHGGWIIRKCAKALGGIAALKFFPDKTVFTLSIGRRPDQLNVEDAWRLPDGTWAIGLDDSKMQRHVLRQIFRAIGVPDDKVLVFGETQADMDVFAPTVVAHVQNHPDDVYILVVDEHLTLDLTHGLSGSQLLDDIRVLLGPAASNRVLTLVRSASTNALEIQRFHQRADGVIDKSAPNANSVVKNAIKKFFGDRLANNGKQLEARGVCG